MQAKTIDTIKESTEKGTAGKGFDKKKLYIKTWGCQMNVYDSRKMADVLAPLGYREVQSPEGADMIVLNTCHIREKATEKVFSELGRLREHKQKSIDNGQQALIAVAGCVAQAEGDLITRRADYVDMVIGPQSYHKLPEMVLEATGGAANRDLIETDFTFEDKFDKLPGEHKSQGPSAFLSIQEGCDKFCTFCVVPYTRGAEYSRPVQAILDEANRMADGGTREITLLGQNVNAYHGAYHGAYHEPSTTDNKVWSLGRLIEEIAKIDGIERIRYTTSHPRDVDDSLIAAHRDIDKLMPFLHLPVQSGSDRILKAMNRKHSADDYRRTVEKFREARPDIAMSSDFIVGFPGESDEDFEATMQVVRDIDYVFAYSFKYSPRPGTPAASMPGLLSEPVKSTRLEKLQALLNDQQLTYNENCIGQTMDVLLERKGWKVASQMMGRTPFNQSVHVNLPDSQNADQLFGTIVPVKITAAKPNSLEGTVIL